MIEEKVKIEDAYSNDILKEIFITENIGLARKIAHKYSKNSNREFEDMFALASYGLVKAFNTFDISKDYAFSTYAYRIMNNEILMEFRKDDTKLKYAKTLSIDSKLKDSRGKGDKEKEISEILIVEEKEYDDYDLLLAKMVLEKLKEDDEKLYKIFNMYIIDKMKANEIAKKLGISQPHATKLSKKAVLRAREIAFENEIIEEILPFSKRKKRR